MTRFSVNYEMSLAIDVTQDEIDRTRKELYQCDNHEDTIFDITVNFQSPDSEIALYVGISKYRQAEVLEISEFDTTEYSKKEEERLAIEDTERNRKH